MKRLSEEIKLDSALTPQSLNGNDTGEYYNMQDYRNGLFALNCGAIADGGTVKMEILQASDAAGTGSKTLKDIDGAAVSATITAPIKATEATLTLDTVVATNAVTINGTTLTAIADGSEDYAAQTFSVGTTPTDAECATDLTACINANFDDIKASAAAAVVTISAVDPGETLITIVDDAATITPAVTMAQSYIDIQTALLDTENDFSHVAAKVTTESASAIGVELARYSSRYMPDQKVGDSSLV